MAEAPNKAMILLEAYEDLTSKETLCLKEGNFDGVLRAQKKKALLFQGLEELQGTPLRDEDRAAVRRRLEHLKEQEAANSAELQRRMKENREELKKLSANASSASKLRRAYAKPDVADRDASGLEGKA